MEKKLHAAEKQLKQNRDNVKIILTKKELETRRKNGTKNNMRNAHQFNLHVMETIKPWIAMNYHISFEQIAERLNNKILWTRQGKHWDIDHVKRIYTEYEHVLDIKKKRKKNCKYKKRRRINNDGDLEEDEDDSNSSNYSDNGLDNSSDDLDQISNNNNILQIE